MKTLKLTTLFIALAGFTHISAQAADMSVGLNIGSYGVGAQVSGLTSYHFIENDQIQWRAVVGGLSGDIDDDDEIELNDIDYRGDVDVFGVQLGADWYPFEQRGFFVSGGLAYFDHEFDLRSVPGSFDSKARLNTEIEHDSVAPYISVGWGNKIDSEPGFSFYAETGLLLPLNDADVTVSNPNGGLSAAYLAQEKNDIEDDLDGVQLLFNLGVSYHF